jgi:hypothetical protein
MHHPLLHPLQILHPLRTRIRQPRPLLHRQCINISSQQQRLTLSILQNSGNAMPADGTVDFVGFEGFEVRDNGGGGGFFLEGEFGVGVEVLI